MNYRLGDVTIDTGRQQVVRGNDPVALPKLSYELLLALVRAAPNVVSLDELMRQVWSGLIVSPETVSQRVKMLRDALADDPREPRYIRGLRGRGYQLVPAVAVSDGQQPTPPAPASAAAPAAAPIAAPAQPVSAHSVAVLPFLDLSEKRDQEYFADGLAEELINLLTQIPELQVPARTSSFYFKGKSEDIPTIARRLLVAHVLEGSVRKSADRLRVTAQLVRADNGYHLWSETYDRRLDDVFQVQDDIAASVVKALKVRLLDASVRHAAPTSNSEAYTLYLQAESLVKRNSSADSLRAHECLQRALRLDPDFALAWAALAELYTEDSVAWGRIFTPQEDAGGTHDLATTNFLLGTNTLPRAAHEAGRRALELAPREADVHRAMARVLIWFGFDWDAADAHLRQARSADAGDARTSELSARLALTLGRLTEGLALANRAIAQDPLGTAYWLIGAAQHRLGALEQAAAAYRRLIELHPTLAGARFRLGTVLLCQQQPQSALEQFERDEPWYREAGLALALDALGRRSEADAALARLERDWGSGMAYQIAYVYAARAEVERAIVWLERAYDQHDAGLLSIKLDPMLTALFDQPGFQALLRRMKLPL